MDVKFIAYRKASRLPKRDQEHIENRIRRDLEERVRLQRLLHPAANPVLPVLEWSIDSIEQAEQAAEQLRKLWQLGQAPIASVVGVLEEHFVHVLDIETREGFDGISAVAYAPAERAVAAVAVTRHGVAGERQRRGEVWLVDLQPSWSRPSPAGNLTLKRTSGIFGSHQMQ
ncbi:hypothetical protein [Gloeobacter violaceus]|uniref:Glr2471 protein n=1 Tax=Gloeobacter violaceus (strain ATCC 29082 / PCC 7421) TaxID=251221 RepID=Q7NHR4_GLOVI|nr:hypothetical protein [Gloeobacter violaceus]BAC90412.1 glr2471 [Gloeobacter violaceus PCC 7421]